MLFVIGYGPVADSLLPLTWVTRATRRRIWISKIRWLNRRELGFRLAAEFTASGLLVVSALGLLWGVAWAAPSYVLALGMLIHTLIRSPGDIGGQIRWPIALFVGTLLAGVIGSLVLLFASDPLAIHH